VVAWKGVWGSFPCWGGEGRAILVLAEEMVIVDRDELTVTTLLLRNGYYFSRSELVKSSLSFDGFL